VQATDAAEVRRFVQHDQPSPLPPVELVVHLWFKPELNKAWFGALNKLWGIVLGTFARSTALVPCPAADWLAVLRRGPRQLLQRHHGDGLSQGGEDPNRGCSGACITIQPLSSNNKLLWNLQITVPIFLEYDKRRGCSLTSDRQAAGRRRCAEHTAHQELQDYVWSDIN
jgi:hypothetical protein